MQALALAHMQEHQLTPKSFLRNCYFWRFGKDITDEALRIDCDTLMRQGNSPPYVVAYLLHIYGCAA